MHFTCFYEDLKTPKVVNVFCQLVGVIYAQTSFFKENIFLEKMFYKISLLGISIFIRYTRLFKFFLYLVTHTHTHTHTHIYIYGKVIPLQARCGPEGG